MRIVILLTVSRLLLRAETMAGLSFEIYFKILHMAMLSV